jgi:Zn-dependent peptidase ImmA (M78 family)/transcriptional regulator with XRE-family HTH domain
MMNYLESKERIIIGSQLQRARELLRFTPEEVAVEIGATSQDIINWEQEKSRPKLKQLEDLARFYAREIDYFLRETPAPPTDIEFRGKSGLSLRDLSRETRIILSKFDELCRNDLEFDMLLNKKVDIKLPGILKGEPPYEAAKVLRKNFNANDKPLFDLRDRLEEEGMRIFELPVLDESFSGFSFWHNEYGPCILLNAKEPRGRKNFTLAHELAHILYTDGSSICYIPSKYDESYKGIEYKANQFAVEILLPKTGVIEDFKKRNYPNMPTEKELAQMASKWGVSIQALGYRLENLSLIVSGITDTFIESKPKHLRPPKIPAWQRQLGKRYIKNSIDAYKMNLISLSKLAHSLRLPIRRALEIVEQKGK